MALYVDRPWPLSAVICLFGMGTFEHFLFYFVSVFAVLWFCSFAIFAILLFG